MKKLFKHLVNFIDLVAYERRISERAKIADSTVKCFEDHLANLSDYEKDEDLKRNSKIVADTCYLERDRNNRLHELLMKSKL